MVSSSSLSATSASGSGMRPQLAASPIVLSTSAIVPQGSRRKSTQLAQQPSTERKEGESVRTSDDSAAPSVVDQRGRLGHGPMRREPLVLSRRVVRGVEGDGLASNPLWTREGGTSIVLSQSDVAPQAKTFSPYEPPHPNAAATASGGNRRVGGGSIKLGDMAMPRSRGRVVPLQRADGGSSAASSVMPDVEDEDAEVAVVPPPIAATTGVTPRTLQVNLLLYGAICACACLVWGTCNLPSLMLPSPHCCRTSLVLAQCSSSPVAAPPP